jgi:hypothetical protein
MPIPNSVLVDAFLEQTPVRRLVSIPTGAIEQAMATAYHCFCAGAHADAEVLCKGLVAADHRHWYCRALYAATLVKLGRPREALVQVVEGLRRHPGQPRLVAIKKEILATALKWGLEAGRGGGSRGPGDGAAAPPPPQPAGDGIVLSHREAA